MPDFLLSTPLMADAPPIRHVTTKPIPGCSRFVEQAYEFARRDEIQTVVIAGQWNGYLSSEAYLYDGHKLSTASSRKRAIEELRSELESLTRAGKQVFLVLNIPVGHEFGPRSV